MHDRHTHNTPITILSFYSLTHFSLSHTFIQSILLLHSSSENHSVSTHTLVQARTHPLTAVPSPLPLKANTCIDALFSPANLSRKCIDYTICLMSGGFGVLVEPWPLFLHMTVECMDLTLTTSFKTLSVNVRLGEVLTSLFTMSTVCLTSRTCQYVSLQASERTLSVWLPGILFVFPDSFTVNTSRLFILSG